MPLGGFCHANAVKNFVDGPETGYCSESSRETINGTSNVRCAAVQLELTTTNNNNNTNNNNVATMWVVRREGLQPLTGTCQRKIHKTCQTQIKCKWGTEQRASWKKPPKKLNYPMFTISLQILTLALHTHSRINSSSSSIQVIYKMHRRRQTKP